MAASQARRSSVYICNASLESLTVPTPYLPFALAIRGRLSPSCLSTIALKVRGSVVSYTPSRSAILYPLRRNVSTRLCYGREDKAKEETIRRKVERPVPLSLPFDVHETCQTRATVMLWRFKWEEPNDMAVSSDSSALLVGRSIVLSTRPLRISPCFAQLLFID